MVETPNFEAFNADYRDTKNEIRKLTDLIENWQLTENDLNNERLKNYINKDKRLVNEVYLSSPSNTRLIKTHIVENIKTRNPDLFNQLKEHRIVPVDNQGNIPDNWINRPWSGPKWVKFLQVMLNYNNHPNPPLEVDWAFGVKTFWELIKFQKDDNNALKSDGIAGKRTISKLVYNAITQTNPAENNTENNTQTNSAENNTQNNSAVDNNSTNSNNEQNHTSPTITISNEVPIQLSNRNDNSSHNDHNRQREYYYYRRYNH